MTDRAASAGAAVVACTIIARNYLPFARVLARSYEAHHPGQRMIVLVIDELGDPDPREPFEVLRLDDLAEDPAELRRMAAIYDVLELATALKPWLLEYVRSRGAEVALYLDPDMWVLGPLEDVGQAAARSSVALIPHVTSPVPRDHLMVDETSLLAAGTFNLGFIAVGPGSERFIADWKLRLRRDCIIDPEGMHFVDQRWVDILPGAFRCEILTDPGLNVAYWNLHERPVGHEGETWTAGGVRLRLFHFSGYAPEAPYLLSKHQGLRPRIRVSNLPELRRLCDRYREELVGAGYGVDNLQPYGRRSAANGLVLDHTIRRILRSLLLEAQASGGGLPPDVFDPDGADALLRLLNGPPDDATDPGHLSVYLSAVYADRTGLHREFPDPQGADRGRFLEWARREASAGHIDFRLVAAPLPDGTVPDLGVSWPPADQLQPGVLLAGYFNAELGVGEGARLMADCLQAAHLPYATWTWRATASRQQHPFDGEGEGQPNYDTNIVCVNADQLPLFAATVGPDFFAGRYTVGQWAWELEEFPPEWQGSFGIVSEVWAVSAFTRRAIAARTEKPVFAVPHAIVRPRLAPGVDRESLGLPTDRTVFLFAFDLASRFERKNPEGLVRAFRRAFRPDEGPVLVLKAINASWHLDDLERLRYVAGEHPDVRVIDEYLDVGSMAALMDAADCYVSLHRSEGFGLTLGEAMALGKPVIATGYSGNLDFMTPETSYLVPWEPGRVPPGCAPYRAGARWAQPDLEEAARLLRLVAERPAEALATGERARRHVELHHGPAARAPFITERLRAIQDLRTGVAGGSQIPLAGRLRQAPRAVLRRSRLAASILRHAPP